MKIILSRKQIEKIPNEKYADIFFKWFNSNYPDYFEKKNVVHTHINGIEKRDEIIDPNDFERNETDNNRILFYFDEDKDFYASIDIIHEFHKNIRIPFFEIEKISKHDSNSRKKFNDIMRIVANKYFNQNVKQVWFHFE